MSNNKKLTYNILLSDYVSSDVSYVIQLYCFDKNIYEHINSHDIKVLNVYVNQIDWKACCAYIKLNNNILKKFCDYLDWQISSIYQNLSKEIMYEFKNKIN
jgi:hypothetical protein